MYALDTDVLSNLLKRAPSPQLAARLRRVPADAQYTTSITLGELVYGAHRLAERTAMLLPRIDTVLMANPTVLPFDEGAARRYGELRAHLERVGTPLADADLRIASITLLRGLTLVTANTRHFARVPGLAVENWLT